MVNQPTTTTPHKLEQFQVEAKFCSTPNFYSHLLGQVWTQSQIPTLQCWPISAVHLWLPVFACCSTSDFRSGLPVYRNGSHLLCGHQGFLQPHGYQAWISAHHLGIYSTVTLPELFLVDTGINEWRIKHGVVAWLASDALVLCPLCLTHTFGFLTWEKGNALAFL